MSCDFCVWYPYDRLSNKEAQALYERLCEGESAAVQPHPAVTAFYEELTSIHPEIDTIDEDHVDDVEYCPWSCAMDYSPGHVVMACVWPKADHVGELVQRLAVKHGLAMYDPQSDRITYPDSEAVAVKRPWWRFW